MNSNKKNEEIKLRVTKQEKEQIRKLSSSSKNMTAYILKKVFAPDSDNHKSITETVETLDLVNTIMLEVEKSTDDLLKQKIKNILAERI